MFWEESRREFEVVLLHHATEKWTFFVTFIIHMSNVAKHVVI